MATKRKTTAKAKPRSRTKSNGQPTDVEEKLRLYELLLDVSQRVSAIDTLDEVLETLVSIATKETGATRGTLFLNDDTTGELYSRVAMGNNRREIRILNSVGVAGHVYQNGEGAIIHDAYSDGRFDASVDKETGFKTRSILCAPIKTAKGDVIGVIQTLNRESGKFTKADLHLLETMTMQAAITLQSRQNAENVERTREEEKEFVNLVADVTSELELSKLLKRVMEEAKKMLKADRSTLFLNDEKSNELWSEVGTGLESTKIRFPNHLGIAGAVYTAAETINIPYAYADLRFNPSFDKKTGYFTRSILAVPVINKEGKVIGVTQVLNKKGGPFSEEDESRLKAFTAQISIGLENAKLFADIQNMQKYNESILESMTNGVITLDVGGRIVTCNAAGMRMLQVSQDEIISQKAEEFFSGRNTWINELSSKVAESQKTVNLQDVSIYVLDKEVYTNIKVQPLISSEFKKLGTMLMIEDISSEKRHRQNMRRFMGEHIATRLAEDRLPRQASALATVLFSDIRDFTSLTEELGPEGTVSFLNEYFTRMQSCVEKEDGSVDKFIGDALMAGFGHLEKHEDDPDRAVRTALAMIREVAQLNEQRAAREEEPIRIGVGINTDDVVIGEIGSDKYANITMIGDGVNLAARLESACKQYHTTILISENTYRLLKGTYRIREIDKVIVKGKTLPVSIYELLDYHTKATFPNIMEVLTHFSAGLSHYRKRSWDKAIKSFNDALKANPHDKLSAMYVERCEYLKQNPPAKDWSGVWVMTSK